MEKFCNIGNRNELADFLKIPRKKLTHILYVKKIENCYTSFEIPKKSGGTRKINAPVDELKSIQLKLSNALCEYQKELWKEKSISPNISHAFEKGKSIFTNSKIHRNKRYLLNIDLNDFFDCFHFGRVRGFFIKNKDFQLPVEVATVIAQLSCYKGCLPQGAPTSPIITNLICNILDMRLLKIAKKYLLDYTRYADDLSFSTNNKNFLDYYDDFFEEISKEISIAGFSINNKKTRLQFRDSKQKVTGIVVNKKLNIDRLYYRKTKAMAHNLYTNKEIIINGEPGTVNQLEGRFSFINQIDRYNNGLDDSKHCFRDLNGREEQYRRFLFYKYFYYNSKPMIVTEGKTDIVYIKAALKSLYKDYPGLIEKDENGIFDFKISFLKRNDRINYFFGIGQDGADSMQNLFRYFSSEKSRDKGYVDYYTYFSNLCDYLPMNPVILIFDNELINTKKPLYKFINFVGFTGEQRESLKEFSYSKIKNNSNLFLTTFPLVKNKDECEIEDLFPDSTLSVKLNGKNFCRQEKYDTNLYYGKDIFSKYIFSNYNKIDFTGFKPILDNINEIIKSYNKSLENN